jgi:serine/threonine protein kinase
MLYKFNQSIELDTINETIGHEDSDSCDESSDEEIGFENPVDPTNLEVRKKILANQKIPSTEFFHLKLTITSNYMTEITSYPSQITLNNTQIEITKSLSTNKDVKVYRYDNKVIKVYANKTVWEYYILNQIQKRFNSDMYLEFTLFQNESVLQMDYQGLNLSQFDRLQLDVKQIIIKVCQQVLKLHDIGIIHGDICIENICLQNNDITLVDYAASIDLTVFQDEQYFRLEGGMKDVWERDGWKFEPDWFGVGAVLYYLLVGESLEVVKLEKVKVAGEGLYLEFEELFDLLLNFDSTSSLDSKRLRDLVKSE